MHRSTVHSSSSTKSAEATESDHPATGPHPLQQACEALFEASQKPFDQTDEEKKKRKHCSVLKVVSTRLYWHSMGKHLVSILGRMECSLGPKVCEDIGEKKGLRQVMGLCNTMQNIAKYKAKQCSSPSTMRAGSEESHRTAYVSWRSKRSGRKCSWFGSLEWA